jgi:hypothetical protein
VYVPAEQAWLLEHTAVYRRTWSDPKREPSVNLIAGNNEDIADHLTVRAFAWLRLVGLLFSQ